MTEFNAPNVELAGIAPEIALTIAALLILVAHGVFGTRAGSWWLPWVATAGLVAAAALAVAGWGERELQLAGSIALDGFATFVKVTLAAFGLLTVWLSREYLDRSRLEEAEFYALVVFAVAGMMLMAGAADLIVVFLALETFSLALYVLVGFRRDSDDAQEASMKYFLLGTFASAFFLLGIALAYGAVGSTNFYSTGDTRSLYGFASGAPPADLGLLVLATGLIVVGLGFKIAAVPFHAWTPDAYQGAPSPVTGFMAAGSKVAGFAALIRVLDAALFSLRWDWRPLVIGIAVATMVVGSVLAIVQEDVKRMLAYSSIAHAGFVLTGVIAANDRGVSGALFYLATYGVTVLGAFAVVAILAGRDERRVRLVDYRGAFAQRPLLAGALTLFLLSLAGVPITSGFIGKLLVFGAAVQSGYAWVAVVGALTSVIAAFFYLRLLVVMYMQDPVEGASEPPRGGALANAVVVIAAVATIVFGLAWGPLIDAAERATFFVAGG